MRSEKEGVEAMNQEARKNRNGARGARDMEGKVTRVGASKAGGERVSM